MPAYARLSLKISILQKLKSKYTNLIFDKFIPTYFSAKAFSITKPPCTFVDPSLDPKLSKISLSS